MPTLAVLGISSLSITLGLQNGYHMHTSKQTNSEVLLQETSHSMPRFRGWSHRRGKLTQVSYLQRVNGRPKINMERK